ncbi:MAG: lamin tail domain-containing protein [Bacteroidales bacterium]|nr:lamin tail domain-containing protein [Bacteroidales bacterium]
MDKRLAMLAVAVMMVATAARGQQGLKISELLYQPRSGEAEYVELYNDSGVGVDLAGYHIVRVLHDTLSTHYPLPSYQVAPHGYVVLTKDIASVINCYSTRYPPLLVECNLPSYPNGGGSVVLATADSVVVERLDYRPDMHSPLLRDKAGVSLERRSFARPCNEAGNWFSASSVAGYGTPGYENSQSTEWLVEEVSFAFSSELVSPDGDDYQDVLTVEYRMDRADLTADAAVFSAAGVKVAQLLNGVLLGTHGSFEWDAAGVPQGRYMVVVTIYDRSGTHQVLRRPVAVVAR